MRQQLLSIITLCASIISFAQIPTNNLVKDYKFTNGAITSDVNPILNIGTTTLVANGSNRTITQDRNTEINKAISLNGDWFTAGGTNNPAVQNYAVSFWIKTATNDATKRYIFDQFVQVNPCGWSVALQNGQLIAEGQTNCNVNTIYTVGQLATLNSTTINNDQWHHVVFQAKNTITSTFDGTFYHNNCATLYELYIDNVLITSTTKNLNKAYLPTQTFTRRSMNATQALLIGKSTNTAFTGIYTNEIDQIRFYEGNLSALDINKLYMEDKPGVTVYVNASATGANNGTSWADAYTNLNSAISNYNINQEIWVASGVYKPNGTARTSTFNLPSDIKIYGGFNGNETTRFQRNHKTNLTILSGDLSGNDNSNIIHTEATRQDNCYHVISLLGNVKNIIVDGFVIKDGNANGPFITTGPANTQYYHTRGGAIYANPYTTNDEITATFKNCTLEKNSATSTGVFTTYFAGGVTYLITDVNFEACIIKNNHSGGLAAMNYSGANGFNWIAKGKIINCLFHNNTNPSGASCLYFSASTSNGGNENGINVDVINSTFTSNTGAFGNTISGDNGDMAKFYNNIIYGNGSNTPLNFLNGNPGHSNNIIEGGQLLGSTNENPLLDSNYKLTAGSPAINNGDLLYVPSYITTDLDGNNRFVGTVDRGAFEFDASLNTTNFITFSDFKVYPNPASENIYIETNSKIKNIKLFSTDGKLIIESRILQLNIQNLNTGIYILAIENEEGSIGIQKIIKK